MRIEREGRGVAHARGGRGRTMGVLVACLALASACSMNKNPDEMAEPVPPTRLRVENQAFNDMTIYVYRSSQRIRLGTATGNSVTRLTIPANLIFGATPLRFQADPIGGSPAPIRHDTTAPPRAEIRRTIPPRRPYVASDAALAGDGWRSVDCGMSAPTSPLIRVLVLLLAVVPLG